MQTEPKELALVNNDEDNVVATENDKLSIFRESSPAAQQIKDAFVKKEIDSFLKRFIFLEEHEKNKFNINEYFKSLNFIGTLIFLLSCLLFTAALADGFSINSFLLGILGFGFLLFPFLAFLYYLHAKNNIFDRLSIPFSDKSKILSTVGIMLSSSYAREFNETKVKDILYNFSIACDKKDIGKIKEVNLDLMLDLLDYDYKCRQEELNIKKSCLKEVTVNESLSFCSEEAQKERLLEAIKKM